MYTYSNKSSFDPAACRNLHMLHVARPKCHFCHARLSLTASLPLCPSVSHSRPRTQAERAEEGVEVERTVSEGPTGVVCDSRGGGGTNLLPFVGWNACAYFEVLARSSDILYVMSCMLLHNDVNLLHEKTRGNGVRRAGERSCYCRDPQNVLIE